MSERNSLVSQSDAQVNTMKASTGDFKTKSKGQVAQTGKDQLCGTAYEQDCPRSLQDDGPGSSGAGTPSVWGKTGSFTVGKNSGESESGLTAVKEGSSVNMTTGLVETSGYSQTRVKEIGDPKASIPSR